MVLSLPLELSLLVFLHQEQLVHESSLAFLSQHDKKLEAVYLSSLVRKSFRDFHMGTSFYQDHQIAHIEVHIYQLRE